MIERTQDNYIRVFSGRKFWPLNPQLSDISIVDIAHALSQICRFTGHTDTFYSVAQHSVLVAERLLATGGTLDAALIGLLHDASEAYLCDLARPIKHSPVLQDYREAERVLQNAIYERFELYSMVDAHDTAWLKEVDLLVYHAEQRDLMKGDPFHATAAGTFPRIEAWSAQQSELAFLRTWTGLQERRAEGVA